MADNVEVIEGTGGTDIGTKDISGVHYQRIIQVDATGKDLIDPEEPIYLLSAQSKSFSAATALFWLTSTVTVDVLKIVAHVTALSSVSDRNANLFTVSRGSAGSVAGGGAVTGVPLDSAYAALANVTAKDASVAITGTLGSPEIVARGRTPVGQYMPAYEGDGVLFDWQKNGGTPLTLRNAEHMLINAVTVHATTVVSIDVLIRLR